MRLKMFLAVVATAVAAFVGLDCQAKCRCDGGRKAARQERKANKRGRCNAVYIQPNGGESNTYNNPYGSDGIAPTWGAAASRIGVVEFDPYRGWYTVTDEWVNVRGEACEKHCYGTYCIDVRVSKPIPQKPVPQPSQPEVAPKASGTEPAKAPADTAAVKVEYPPGVLPGS